METAVFSQPFTWLFSLPALGCFCTHVLWSLLWRILMGDPPQVFELFLCTPVPPQTPCPAKSSHVDLPRPLALSPWFSESDGQFPIPAAWKVNSLKQEVGHLFSFLSLRDHSSVPDVQCGKKLFFEKKQKDYCLIYFVWFCFSCFSSNGKSSLWHFILSGSISLLTLDFNDLLSGLLLVLRKCSPWRAWILEPDQLKSLLHHPGMWLRPSYPDCGSLPSSVKPEW